MTNFVNPPLTVVEDYPSTGHFIPCRPSEFSGSGHPAGHGRRSSRSRTSTSRPKHGWASTIKVAAAAAAAVLGAIVAAAVMLNPPGHVESTSVTQTVTATTAASPSREADPEPPPGPFVMPTVMAAHETQDGDYFQRQLQAGFEILRPRAERPLRGRRLQRAGAWRQLPGAVQAGHAGQSGQVAVVCHHGDPHGPRRLLPGAGLMTVGIVSNSAILAPEATEPVSTSTSCALSRKVLPVHMAVAGGRRKDDTRHSAPSPHSWSALPLTGNRHQTTNKERPSCRHKHTTWDPRSARYFSSGAQLLHASCGVWQSN